MKHSVVIAVLLLLLVSLGAAQSAPRYGIPIDWSSRHVVSSAADNVDLEQAIRRDPRQVYNWMLHNHSRLQRMNAQQPNGGARLTKVTTTKKGTTSVDWSFPLGTGTVPIHSYPAKYSFDTGTGTLTAANCTSDYVVYALAIAGSSSQPNLVRFQNIYAGTTPVAGLCGSAPTVASAYNVSTAGGTIQTSPVLSFDGTKVAFIESAGTSSVFHVLTWGTTGTNGSFSSNLYSAVQPGASGGNNAVMSSLPFGTTGTTYSSPYIDYSSDRAYFGDDNGKLYRTSCVFSCAGAPAIDTSWPVTVAAAGTKMSPPVFDSNSNKVFLGGSDGKLYLVDLAQCPGTNCTIAGGGLKALTIGANNANGGVFDGVILDSTFETMFAFAGDTGAGNTNGQMVQTDVNFSFTLAVAFGGTSFPIYAGALDDAYYQNASGQTTAPTGNIFSCGSLGGSNQPDLYWTTFTAAAGAQNAANPPKMNTAGAAVSKKNVPGNPGIGCNPLTEFKNGTTDRLFLSQSTLSSGKCFTGSAADGCVMMYNITTPSSTIGNSPNASATENAGTSGIVVDNASGSAQASSLYFANEGTAQCTTGTGAGTTASYCAVKLTQTLFQ